ncbi:MAG: exodeoxyribonuclease VII small subunit [Polyangiaceae bacterium]
MTRAKAAKSETNPEALQSFESSLERLHEIVEQLESGDLDLEASLVLFEEGVRLSRTSQARLNSAEKRIEELLAVDEEGRPVVRELGVPNP